MKSHRFTSAFVLIISFGCTYAKHEAKLVAASVDQLSEQLEDDKVAVKLNHVSAEMKPYYESFLIPQRQNVLGLLKAKGAAALRPPLLVSSFIDRNKATAQEKLVQGSIASRYDNYMQLSWLEVGHDVSGFYFELQSDQLTDKKLYYFRNVIDQTEREFKELAKRGCLRDDTLFFSDNEGDRKQRLLKWPSKLKRALIDDHGDVKMGLILKDGSLTPAGPVFYANY